MTCFVNWLIMSPRVNIFPVCAYRLGGNCLLRVSERYLFERTRNWTISRLRAEIEQREGVRISRSQLSKALYKKSSAGGGAPHAERTSECRRG